MTKTTYKVGDKVRVIGEGSAGLPIGTEAKVIEVDCDGDVYLDVNNVYGNKAFYITRNIELATQKPTKNQRITALEQTVADLQAEVEALKAAQKIAVSAPTMTVKAEVDVAKIAESLAKAIGKHAPKSPNEQRKAIIAEAKAFVADSKNFTGNCSGRKGYRYVKTGNIVCDVEFAVNKEKRTVVALLKHQHGGCAAAKGIAKCAPDDVFNADIGKAIALGHALGLDVSKFEKAAQPTEFAVGQVTKGTHMDTGKVTRIEEGRAYTERYTYWSEGSLSRGRAFIINDTEAQY